MLVLIELECPRVGIAMEFIAWKACQSTSRGRDPWELRRDPPSTAEAHLAKRMLWFFLALESDPQGETDFSISPSGYPSSSRQFHEHIRTMISLDSEPLTTVNRNAQYFSLQQHENYGDRNGKKNLFSRSVARANSALMLHADTPLPAADIARAAELAYTPAVSAITTLEKRGLARRARRAGRDEFEPNKRSLYFPMAYGTALVDLPLRGALHGQRIHLVYAYGSLAQPGGGTRESDLDLLIVGDIKDRAGLIERLSGVGARLNRVIDPFILSPEQFERAKKRGDEHVNSALAGVRLMGDV